MSWFEVEESSNGESDHRRLNHSGRPCHIGCLAQTAPFPEGWPTEYRADEFAPAAPAHRRVGNRVSLLPIAQFCGKAASLSERYGAGRPAAMSTAFHARQAGSPDAPALWARLSEQEQEEVLSWNPPATVVMADGCALAYADAEKEISVGITYEGEWADLDGDDVLTIGHADLAWAPRTVGDLRVAFVGDIKKSAYTTEDGPESLQLHGYGWGLARKYHCDAYCCGLWLAEEGEWLWSKEWVVLDSGRGREIFDRIRYAALHRSEEATTGEHCRHCWSRLHCPEHLLPAELGKVEAMLAPLTEGGDVSLVDHNTIFRLQALGELVDRAKKVAQAAIERGALQVRDPESGKVWAPVEMSGRKRIDQEKLRAELGAKADRYIVKGANYTQFRWIKPR